MHLSSSATAPRYSAAPSITAGSLPNVWPRSTRSKCSPPARRTTSPGRTNTRKGPTASAASPSGDSPMHSLATSRPSTATRSGSSRASTPATTRSSGCGSRGPWCPALLEYLERNQQQYDILIFFTYLYAPTVMGMKVAPHKSILVPTAHDEPAIHLDIYRELFSLPAGIAYNTEVERRFLTTHFSMRALEEETVGCGVDLPQAQEYPREHTGPHHGDDEELAEAAAADDASPTFRPHLAHRGSMFRRRHRLDGPIALYGGRIDPGKGCEELIEYFSTLRAGRRRRVAGADGRQADAVAGGALHPLCRPALRPGARPGARGGDCRRCPVTVREPVAARARIVCRRHADPGQRAERGPGRSLPSRATPGFITRTGTSSRSACGCCGRSPAARIARRATGATTCGRTTGGM